MIHEQVEALAHSSNFPDGSSQTELVETHISWVILTRQFAFKIKKPVHFSFLDFSTLALRKHICEEEVRLNRRLTDIYLAVVPIVYDGRQYGIGIQGETIDYAVKMKRVDGSRQMDLLLKEGLVTPKDIEAIAVMVAHFHRNARVVRRHFDEEEMRRDFSDLLTVIPVLTEQVNEKFSALIPGWIELSAAVLKKYHQRFAERVEENFVRDGHGDLHSRNIFLLEKPVIFDCIEFNEHLRFNDVLSELAFLAMDLDRFGRSDFKEFLIKKYQEKFDCFPQPEDFVIFQYYLFYRATVRLKIAGLSLQEELVEPTTDPDVIRQEILSLATLCSNYAQQLKDKVLE